MPDQDLQKEYQDYLEYQHYQQASQQAQNPQNQITPDAADKTAHGMRDQLTASDLASDNRLKQAQSQSSVGQRLKDLFIGGPSNPATQQGAVGDSLGAAAGVIPMDAAPVAVSSLAKYLSSSGPLRIGTNTAVGAINGAVHNPNDRLSGALKGGAIGLAASSLGEGLSSSGKATEDLMMQKAAGMKGKYIPGVGNEMADQGVFGTKGMMRQQVGDAIENNVQDASDMIKNTPGQISGSSAAQPINNYASDMKVGDVVPEHSISDFSQANDRAQSIANRGDVDPTTAWQFAQKAGAAGFKNQKALQSEQAYLAQLEQQGYMNQVKEAYVKANPGSTDLQNTFASLSKLYKANQGLNTPGNIAASYTLPVLLGGAAGFGTTHDIVGALKGAAAGAALKSPLFQSAVGRGAGMVGDLGSLFANPATVQSLVEAETKK